jgi:sarcosine oxidase subunit alpha
LTRRLRDEFSPRQPLSITLEGKPVRAFEGESVAVALYASEKRVLSRSLKYHRPRAFFCLEGHCGACLMRIDGVPNLRACMQPCAPGMAVEGQNAYPSPDLDMLGAVDWMFPGGMNHHTMMTGSSLMNAVMNKIVRQLSGLGTLPDTPADDLPLPRDRQVDVAIIGAGPAGLAAATAAARAGAATLVIDEQPGAGGSLLGDPRFGPDQARNRTAIATEAGAEILSAATAIAFYPEDDGGVLAVVTEDGLVRLRARRYVYAAGGYTVNRPFVNNDRPGVMAARAVGRLLVQYGVKPADRVCVVGDDAYALALIEALTAAAVDVVAIDDRELRVVGARGRGWVKGITVEDARGKRSKHDCDLIAVSATPAPATEGLRQHGCTVELRPDGGGFAAVVDSDGRTDIADVLACGDVCGFVGPAQAAEQGARTGAVAAAEAGAGR